MPNVIVVPETEDFQHDVSPRPPRPSRRCDGPPARPHGARPPATPCPTASRTGSPEPPSLSHGASSGVSELSLKLLGSHQSSRPFPRPTRLSNQGPFPPPALPGFSGTTGLSATPTAQAGPHGFPVDACHATGGASRVATLSLLPTCHRHYPGGTGRCSRRSLPDRCQPSPFLRRVGFRITRFEACSAFTRCGLRTR